MKGKLGKDAWILAFVHGKCMSGSWFIAWPSPWHKHHPRAEAFLAWDYFPISNSPVWGSAAGPLQMDWLWACPQRVNRNAEYGAFCQNAEKRFNWMTFRFPSAPTFLWLYLWSWKEKVHPRGTVTHSRKQSFRAQIYFFKINLTSKTLYYNIVFKLPA